MGYLSKQPLKASDRQRNRSHSPRSVKVECNTSNFKDGKVEISVSWEELIQNTDDNGVVSGNWVTYNQGLDLTADENSKIAEFTTYHCSSEQRQELLHKNAIRLFEEEKDLFIVWIARMLIQIHRKGAPLLRSGQATDCGANAIGKLQSQACAILLASMKMEDILDFMACVVAFKERSIDDLGLSGVRVQASVKRNGIKNIGDACVATCEGSEGKSSISSNVADALTNAILKAIQ